MKHLAITLLAAFVAMTATAQRQEVLLTSWRFSHDDAVENASEQFNDRRWQSVTVPHDWAIDGPFNKEIDKQTVRIEQNGEQQASEKTGRSGSLPWIGVGWYRTRFIVGRGAERAILNFDGAMSEPEVYVNGQKAGEWKYGYSAFNIDVTPYIYKDGRPNTLAVRLQNLPESSRWYPGAGLYRPVTLITTAASAIKEWGINVETKQQNFANRTATVEVTVSAMGCYLSKYSVRVSTHGQEAVLPISYADCLGDITASGLVTLSNVQCWSPEHPQCYDLTVSLEDGNGRIVDQKTVKYGIRTLSYDERGFVLNGRPRKFKGVCLHHDLGMLGAAVNRAALAHQLVLLKEMGCDAIRTAHNMPSQWQMDLCDSLGMMVMAESFDMWKWPKVKNGYGRFYDEWWRRDLTNLIKANRLHPSIVMWSIGNEIPEQGSIDGTRMIRDMQNHVHRHDPTRPVTTGMDRIDNALSSGFAQVIDIPGINYRLPRYVNAYQHLCHGFLLGSETASTVSSRGVYKFPVVPSRHAVYDDGQCSGYDVEACPWSNLPDEDWAMQDDLPWVIGEFVWTGFDYLGEPTPYDEYWPSRSSYFGIFDLAGLPKDRYYLYRSRWNPKQTTIHLLPHWTWPGRGGQVTPVYCYTNHPTAELFVNGKSQGRITKNTTYNLQDTKYEPVSADNTTVLDRYRLRWNDVVYEPGELRVVVYDDKGNQVGEEVVRTAGAPHHIEISADRSQLHADGSDMAFLTVRIVDKDGNLCPDADTQVTVKVTGAGRFKGICNGDATSLEPFTRPTMKAFHGMLSVGLITTEQPGDIRVQVNASGLRPATLTLNSR